jgi:hypothetical protein
MASSPTRGPFAPTLPVHLQASIVQLVPVLDRLLSFPSRGSNTSHHGVASRKGQHDDAASVRTVCAMLHSAFPFPQHSDSNDAVHLSASREGGQEGDSTWNQQICSPRAFGRFLW